MVGKPSLEEGAMARDSLWQGRGDVGDAGSALGRAPQSTGSTLGS